MLGEAKGQPSLLTFYDRHGNPVGDTQYPHANLTAAPEEETKEDDPVPEITGVDQEPPDKHQNGHDIDYRTEEVGNPIEDAFQINDDPQPQDNIRQQDEGRNEEPVQLLYAPVPAPTRRSTRFKKPVSRIVPSFSGKKYNTAATIIN